MRGSRLPLKIPARRKAAATRLQSAWRALPARRAARPVRREFLTMRAAALKVQVAWLARRRARFAAASRLERPPLWLGMSTAARKQACRAAITRNYAKLREDGGGFCVCCCEPSPVEEMEKMNERDDCTTICPCGIDAVLPFSALPRNPIERLVLVRWCHNDSFFPTIDQVRVSYSTWTARRELQRAGRYVLFAKRLERAYFEAMDRRYAPGSVGETEAMLSFRAAAAAPPAAGAAA